MTIALVGGLPLVLLASTAAAQASVGPAAPGSPSLLTFHRQGDRLLAVMGRELLESDFLLSAQVVAVTGAAGEAARRSFAGDSPALGAWFTSGALQLRRKGGSVVVSEYAGAIGERPRYRRRATTPVVHTLPEGAVVIDAAPLWEALEPDNSAVVHAMSVPVAPFFSLGPDDSLATAGLLPRSPTAATVVRPLKGYAVTYAIDAVRLPKVAMQPRLHDPRVPFFRKRSARQAGDSSSADQSSTAGAYVVSRYRLEKQDTSAPVSDVVQPIIARISKSVPEQWVPHFKQAIEAWNPAFESIGFRHAIKVLTHDDAPPADSQREVTFHWAEQEKSGASGSNITDPRSGELLGARITVFSGLVHAMQRIYFGWVGLLDARARFPFPDSLTGMLLQVTVRHEFGHALGLDHNFQGDAYPTDSLRRPDFVRRMGSMPTTMGYSWANYVGQLEDKLPLEQLISHVGPYDRWMLHWGYSPIPGAATPEAELPTLERWRTAQDTAAYFRGSLAHLHSTNPYYQTEALGDDLLKSVGYGIHNVARLTETIKSDLTDGSRSALKTRWHYLLRLVPGVIGGVVPRAPYPRDINAVELQPIDSAYQHQALRFVLAHAFYGQDEWVAQILPQPPRGDSTLIFFESLLPEWEESQKIWTKPIQGIQAELLSQVVGGLSRLAEPARSRTLPALCKELAVFERRLLAFPLDSLTATTRQHVETLASAVAAAFAPDADLCRR
jgi:hypothetical protein